MRMMTTVMTMLMMVRMMIVVVVVVVISSSTIVLYDSLMSSDDIRFTFCVVPLMVYDCHMFVVICAYDFIRCVYCFVIAYDCV